MNPAAEAYDPAFAYEVATIVRHGLRRMWLENEDVIYYLTLYNENQVMPAMPEDAEKGVIEGLYRWSAAPDGPKHRATILFSGSANLAAREAQAQLAEHYDVAAELFSATSYKRLREQALSTERWNRLHPDQPAAHAAGHRDPRRARARSIAVTDFMKAIPDQIARWVPAGPQLHPARHRRLRAQRHPRGAAPPLRDRRPPRRGGHPGRAGRGRRREAGAGAGRHRPLRPRPRAGRPAPRLAAVALTHP